MKSLNHHENGSAIIWVFIAIGLFAALTFAINRSSRTSTSFVEDTISDAESADDDSYNDAIQAAEKRLELRGCSDAQISMETPSGDNVNASAPTDKRCHVFHAKGGQVKYRE